MRGKPVRDHPLVNNDGQQAQRFGGFGGGAKIMQLEKKNYEQTSTTESGEDNSDDEAGGILDKVKAVSSQLIFNLVQYDPLAEFADIENPTTLDFESWEAKKLKIFAMFKKITDAEGVMIDERRDRNIDRPIRMGQGKSRMELVENKNKEMSATP